MMRRRLLVPALGAALLALELVALGFQRDGAFTLVLAAILAQGAVYLVAAHAVAVRGAGRIGPILLVAALLRVPLLLAPPYLSDDVYRYVWDGTVQAAGVNPYRFAPAAPELAPLRDDRIYPHINRRDSAVTIYPPAAQAFFLATTRLSRSVAWMKASMVAWEALAVGLLLALLRRAGRPASWVLLYAWHPLPLWEFAGNGHLDAAAIACVLGALLARERGRSGLAGVVLGVATLFKLYPLALLPALWRPGDRRLPIALGATVVTGYLPYLGAGAGVLGYLPGYLHEEGLTSGARFWLLQVAGAIGLRVHPAAYAIPVAVALAALAAWVALRRRPRDDHAGAALLVGSTAVVAFSPHYAWYVAWLLPLGALRASVPVLLLGVTAFLLYLEAPATRAWIGAALYLPFLTLAARRARSDRAARAALPEDADVRPTPAA
jgi:hypothetical protein